MTKRFFDPEDSDLVIGSLRGELDKLRAQHAALLDAARSVIRHLYPMGSIVPTGYFDACEKLRAAIELAEKGEGK